MQDTTSESVQRLTGWGRSSYAKSWVIEPTTADEVLAAMNDASAATLARGAGRSYGDAALNEGGRITRTTRMKAVHAFNPDSGEIVVDPGVTFGDLLHEYAPRGWIPPVTPDTQFATIAGAVANDVHGKNHDRDGSIGDHVRWLDLVLPDGTLQRVDRGNAREVFEATIGGIGLTGVMTRISLRMKRVPGSTLVRERRLRISTNTSRHSRTRAHAVNTRSGGSMAWRAVATSDGASSRLRTISRTRGHYRGAGAFACRSIFPKRRSIPGPSVCSIAATSRASPRGRERKRDLAAFFYPLDMITDWNRMYGRSGFVQFQCVNRRRGAACPARAAGRDHDLRPRFLSRDHQDLGSNGAGCLSFPMRGVTLALDFPLRRSTGNF